MFKKNLMLFGVLGAVMAMPSFAHAEDAGEKMHHKGEKMMHKMFEKGDANGDGVISKEEFMAKAEERFTKMDANSDGQVTKEEAKAHHEEMRKKWKEHKDSKDVDIDVDVKTDADE